MMAISSLRQLVIEIKPAQLSIEYRVGRVKVDLTESLADLGLKGPTRLGRDAAQKGWQAAHEGIAKKARKGDRLRWNITAKGALLLEPPPQEVCTINVDMAPKHRPEISVVPGWLRIYASTASVQVELTHNASGTNGKSGLVNQYV